MILYKLTGIKSPEAELCASAYQANANQVERLVSRCGSGCELIERGYSEDVHFSTQMDVFSEVPILNNGRFIRFQEEWLSNL